MAAGANVQAPPPCEPSVHRPLAVRPVFRRLNGEPVPDVCSKQNGGMIGAKERILAPAHTAKQVERKQGRYNLRCTKSSSDKENEAPAVVPSGSQSSVTVKSTKPLVEKRRLSLRKEAAPKQQQRKPAPAKRRLDEPSNRKIKKTKQEEAEPKAADPPKKIARSPQNDDDIPAAKPFISAAVPALGAADFKKNAHVYWGKPAAVVMQQQPIPIDSDTSSESEYESDPEVWPLGVCSPQSMSSSSGSSSDGEESDTETMSRTRADDDYDIDRDDVGYPEFVPEYAVDIYAYLFGLEARHRIDHTYPSKQKHITLEHRQDIICYLTDLHEKRGYLQESFFLGIITFDRFLSVYTLQKKDDLELIAITCLYIAAKFEEVRSPKIRDLLDDYAMFPDQYRKARQAVIEWEGKVLTALKFSLATVYPIHFLRRFSKSADASPVLHTMGKYLIDVAIGCSAMLPFNYSTMAAAALYISLHLLEDGDWAPIIVHHTRHAETDIASAVCTLYDAVHALSEDHVTFHKYAAGRFFSIARDVKERMRHYRPPEWMYTMCQANKN